jgi:class 3 adenylate cyclase
VRYVMAREKVVVLHSCPTRYVWLRGDAHGPRPSRDSGRPRAARGRHAAFLFTDLEGSTPLWEQHDATMHAVSARHDALRDPLIVAHGGRQVRERAACDSRVHVSP